MAWLNEDSNRGDGRPRSADGEIAEFSDRVEAAAISLRGSDPVLAQLIDRHGPCTLKTSTPYFPVMVETVISQQLSTKAARAIHGRLLRIVGRKTPRPADILSTPDEDLLAIGFSRSKARYVKNVAAEFQSGRMGARTLTPMPDADVMALLIAIKGIGEWSAHMFLIFALGRLDVFPVGDLGLRNAMAAAYRLRRPPSLARLNQIGDRWRPYRTIGTWYLWESYDNG
jgi:DNA-3-methyladenine glycosylase II